MTKETKKQDYERYQAKQRLIRILYQRQWDKQRIINLFGVLDWLMRLPEGLDKQIRQDIKAIEEAGKMRYITSIERFGIEKGRLEGRVEGRVEGRLEGKSSLLNNLLARRFGALPGWAVDRLANATEQDLDFWAEAMLAAPSLEAVFENQATH